MHHTLITVSSILFSAITINAKPLFHVPRSLSYRSTAIAGYSYTGCATEGNGTRALSGQSYYDDLLTIEKCANECSSFQYFGVEYGRECYCGNSLSISSSSAPETDCNVACGGNSTEVCGGGNRLSVYAKNASQETTTPQTPTQQTPMSYFSRGCYSEASNGRALASLTVITDTMTVEECAASCANYTMFGLEYYNQCYCGDSLAAGSITADSAGCKYPCQGDSSELCGGDARLNLYQYGSNDTTTSTPTQGNYTSVGCYTELMDVRALNMATFSSNSMTVEMCASNCLGYTWFGVEYGSECYCSNAINSRSELTASTECNMSCPGNTAEFCGGSNRLNVYYYGTVATSTSAVTSSTILSSSTSQISTTTSLSSSQVTTSAISSTSSSSSSSKSSSASSSTTITSSPITSSSLLTSTRSSSSTPSSSSSITPTKTSSSSTACKTPLIDANFEEENPSKIPWSVYNSWGSSVGYDLSAPSSPYTSSSYDGSHQAFVSYNFGIGAQPGIYQTVTLCANTVYTLSAWTKFDGFSFFPSSVDAVFSISNSGQSKTISQTSVRRGAGWVRSSGTYTTGSTAESVTLSVRFQDSGISVGRRFYVDGISFVAK